MERRFQLLDLGLDQLVVGTIDLHGLTVEKRVSHAGADGIAAARAASRLLDLDPESGADHVVEAVDGIEVLVGVHVALADLEVDEAAHVEEVVEPQLPAELVEIITGGVLADVLEKERLDLLDSSLGGRSRLRGLGLEADDVLGGGGFGCSGRHW